jgi:hypothetical protein
VLPSWRDRVHIALSPTQLEVWRYSRGWRPKQSDHTVKPCNGRADHGENSRQVWAPAVETLREFLVNVDPHRASATLVLSNHYVRYVLVPWSATLVTEQEQLAFARARFVKMYGEAARDWVVRLSGASAGSDRVAAGVERALVDSVTTLLRNSPLVLKSIQPQLMAWFNAARKMIGPDAWLAIAEPGRVLLGLVRGGQWISLRSRPLNSETVALAELLDQERMMSGIEAGRENICLRIMPGVKFDTSGLRVQSFAGPDTAMVSSAS